MKKAIMIAGMLGISAMAQADVITATISKQATYPASNLGVKQLVANTGNGAGIQVRDRGADDLRSVTQTFRWDSDLSMDGLGLLISDEPQEDGAYTTNQTFTLDVQLLDSTRHVQSTVANVTFVIKPSDVARGSYIYIDFDTDLPLANGSLYGLNLRTSDVQNNRLYLARGGDANSTYDFAGQQLTTNQSVAAGSTYVNGGWDITFYTTTVPVPETASLGLLSCLGFPLLISRKR